MAAPIPRVVRSLSLGCARGFAALAVALAGGSLALATTSASAPRFFSDDPITVYPETQDASSVRPWEPSEGYDFVANALMRRGERADRRALDVNTIDEVPDSSWFTNRIGSRPMSIEELRRGPDRTGGPADGVLRVTRGKAAGVSPGFQARDARGDLYFVKLDPPGYPELASAAEVISTKLLWAAGYFVPENHVVTITRDRLSIEGATVTGRNLRERSMTEGDLDFILRRAARSADGSYRLLASKAAEGRPLGPFSYHGTRPDDPNDLVAHEHRRSLRGLRAFAAWINHADSRGINSLDTLVEIEGRARVRHYLLDFGSTLGSAGIDRKSRRSGNEYLLDLSRGLARIASLGLLVPGWSRVEYPAYRGVGRFEASTFVPERWVPHIPNPAFDNARADDLFWAARRVMAFSDDDIRAIVGEGQLSDPAAEAYLVETLIARRDAIGRSWLTQVNPLVDFSLDPDGTLRFANAAVDHGVATPPSEYRARWSEYDNGTDTSLAAEPETASREATSQVPAALLDRAPAFLKVEVWAVHDRHVEWSSPVEAYFRRDGTGWHWVGLWRLP